MSRPHLNPPRLCDVDGCSQPHRAKGLCIHHYNQWHYKWGPPPTPAAENPLAVVCPNDLLPLVTQAVTIDARRLFRVAWAWCGIEALRTQALADDKRGAA